jgi:plasmid stabilization system protein ParE
MPRPSDCTSNSGSNNLHHFPESGRKVPEDKTGTYRELLVGNYRVVYRVDEDTVTIVTLIHGARVLRF